MTAANNNKKTFAFVSTMQGSYWGGSEHLWSQTALRLLRKGHRVCANVFWWPMIPQALYDLKKSGCELIRRSGKESNFHRLLYRIWRKMSYKFGRTDYSWLDDIRPDLLVINQGGNCDGLEWMTMANRKGIKYAVVAHNVTPNWPSEIKSMKLSEAYGGAETAFFVSEANLEQSRLQFVSDLNNARLVRNPFQVRYNASLAWPQKNPHYKLAFLGRLDIGIKGLDILIEVLARENWRHRNLIVNIFGAGKDEAVLHDLVKQLKLTSVRFKGEATDIESVWATNHALILPSYREGLPIVIVEAMLCGRTCIATNVGGSAEIIENNKDGFVAAGPSALCLDEAMERAWQRRAEWKKIGQLAAQNIRKIVPADPAGIFAQELMALT